MLKYPDAGIKFILRYAKERCMQKERDTAYRIYVTDCLKGIMENTAKFGGGTFRKDRYADIYEAKTKCEKSAEEIVHEVTRKAGLVVIDE